MERKLLFRCSGLGALLTDKQGSKITNNELKTIQYLEQKVIDSKPLTDNQKKTLEKLYAKRDAKFELSDTAKTFVKELWLWVEKGFRKDIKSKYLEKGIYAEEECISLLTNVDKVFYKKNKIRKDNGVISGECDVIHIFKSFEELPQWRKDIEDGTTKFPLKVVQDTKASWDPETFMNSSLDKMYEAQGCGYMELFECDEFWLRYCLVDCPVHVYEYELYKFCSNKGILDTETQENQILIQEFREKHFFSDNPNYTTEERVKTFVVKKDESVIEKIYDRIPYAIEYYKSLTLNKI